MQDLPTIVGSAYASAVHTHANNWGAGRVGELGGLSTALFPATTTATSTPIPAAIYHNKESTVSKRRLVQVFIADSDENVPLDMALLYEGEQKFTDATDQELFFEVDINSILKAYNEKRVKLINKKVKDRTEYLEPAKIRDLKMVVVTIAGF